MITIGILLLLISGFLFLSGNPGAGWLVLKISGGLIILSVIVNYLKVKILNLQVKEAKVDRSLTILDKIGGSNNIDINLSKYGDKVQLLALKDNRLYIGYDKFKTIKIIPYDSIIKLDIKTPTEEVGTAYQYSENTVRNVIKNISVIIYTNEYTEEIVFDYVSYQNGIFQEEFNNILKELERLKLILKEYNPSIDFGSIQQATSIDISIPDLIKKYKELLDINAITIEEYETKKNELLNKKD